MNCPLCGGYCQSIPDSQTNAIQFVCSRYNRSFKVGASVDIYRDEEKQRKLNNLIFEHVMREPYADDEKTFWWFFFEPMYQTQETNRLYRVNLAEVPYPKDLSEKIDRILLNLYRINSSYGYYFKIDQSIARAFFAEKAEEEKTLGIAFIMLELDYLFTDKENFYKIAAKGWQRIDELIRQNAERKQAFMAMAFRTETVSIRDAFRKGIAAAGYSALAIDEKEHNNQIVPEIFDEIDKSKFVVMDVTIPNFGAYYEAGYALGKGKQVIICCKEEAFNDSISRPHFDIAQKSMIVWKTEDELIERLTKRIRATVR